MPASTFSKNHDIAELGPRPQPKLLSRKSVCRSQSQSTAVAISLALALEAISDVTPSWGPSAATNSRFGRTRRMASITWLVVSGRLNIFNKIGVFNAKTP